MKDAPVKDAPATPSWPAAPQQTVQTLHVQKETVIDAPADVVWESILEEMGTGGTAGDGSPMPMKVEAWPGGRWYRDLGNNAGHLWGHVQVIKPPGLLEICGPLPMSYPATNHLQYRLTTEGSRTRLQFTHRGFGLIPREHRDGMPEGWGQMLKRIREIAESRRNKKR